MISPYPYFSRLGCRDLGRNEEAAHVSKQAQNITAELAARNIKLSERIAD
jgi:hypothetical protein